MTSETAAAQVTPNTSPSRAVFLSYASEDAEAAQRIAEALRAAGIEVWFDKNALRGGDAWDRMIRQQIRDCALFIPLISQHSQERLEGYFRFEWRLAVERALRMAAERTFIVPVVIDSTREREALVPDAFRELQWTRLPGGETPSAFVERVRRLLAQQTSPSADASHSTLVSTPIVSPVSSRGVGRWGTILVAAAAVIALAYLGLDRWVLSRQVVSGTVPKSVAVLPLKNESGDPNQQYFSDGISEDLITALSQVPGLKVIGRASSFHFRDSTEDSRTIGEKLGVAHLIEGSVRRAGDTVRVSAELVDAADGTTVWSERYDRPYKDLFALQDEITRAVAGAMRTKLLPSEHAATQSERPPSGSLDAYNALMQGRFYHFRDTEADLRKTIQFYTRATQLDPSYALAWSWLSKTLTDLGDQYVTEQSEKREAFAKGRAAADRAIALAPELAAAHGARGWSLQAVDFDWRGAEAEYRRALALSPDDGDAKSDLSDFLLELGEIEPSIELTRQALTTEPLRAGLYLRLAQRFSALNRLEEAERAIRTAIEMQPDGNGYHITLSQIEIQRGDAQAALAAAQQERSGPWQDLAVALARQIGGNRDAADASVKTAIQKYGDTFPAAIADLYALRNDAESTFKWLDRGLSARDSGVWSVLYDPFILRFKDDPRFAAFCRKVGLPVPGEVSQRT